MDEVIRKVVALGLPGVLLAIAIATTGLAGGAALTTALALLGGPFGMLGGIALLGIGGLVADAVAKVGIDNFLVAVYSERRQNEPHEQLLHEICNLPISDDLKNILKQVVVDGLMAVYCQRRQNESPEQLVSEIRNLPISNDLKNRLELLVIDCRGCPSPRRDCKNLR
jgi:hypothetical protein